MLQETPPKDLVPPGVDTAEQGASLWSDAWHRLAKNKLAIAGLWIVEDAVNHRNCGGLVGQEMAPVVKWPVARDAKAASLVGGGDEAEEKLAAGGIKRRERSGSARSQPRVASKIALSCSRSCRLAFLILMRSRISTRA